MERLPEIYNYDLDDESKPKPWTENNGANMSEYFNYGFNEFTWKNHVDSVHNARALAIKQGFLQNLKLKNELHHPSLNFILPHNYGGFGDPVNLPYEVNIFTEQEDLPQIKPRTV